MCHAGVLMMRCAPLLCLYYWTFADTCSAYRINYHWRRTSVRSTVRARSQSSETSKILKGKTEQRKRNSDLSFFVGLIFSRFGWMNSANCCCCLSSHTHIFNIYRHVYFCCPLFLFLVFIKTWRERDWESESDSRVWATWDQLMP